MKQQVVLIVASILAICNAKLFFAAPADESSKAIYSLDISTAAAKIFYKGDHFSTFTFHPTESAFYTISTNSSGFRTTLTRINLDGEAVASFRVRLPIGIIKFLAYSQAQNCFIGAGVIFSSPSTLLYFTMDTNGNILSELRSNYVAAIYTASFAYSDQTSTIYALYFTQHEKDQHLASWNYKLNLLSVSKFIVANQTHAIGTEIAYGPYLISGTLVTDDNYSTQAGYATVEDFGGTAVATIQDPASYVNGWVADIIWDYSKKIWYAIEAEKDGYHLVVYDSEGNPTRKGHLSIDQYVWNFSLLLANF